MKMLRLSANIITLLAAGILAGCSGTSASPDVAGSIRKSLDEAGFKDVSVSQDRDKGIVTLNETGTYFTIVGVQVGSRGGTGLVRLWFQTNGKDADNSNCEQMVATPDFTTVMISQGVGEYKKGDKINAMFSGSAPGIGLVYKKPAGEPAVPSVIFSAWKID